MENNQRTEELATLMYRITSIIREAYELECTLVKGRYSVEESLRRAKTGANTRYKNLQKSICAILADEDEREYVQNFPLVLED